MIPLALSSAGSLFLVIGAGVFIMAFMTRAGARQAIQKGQKTFKMGNANLDSRQAYETSTKWMWIGGLLLLLSFLFGGDD